MSCPLSAAAASQETATNEEESLGKTPQEQKETVWNRLLQQQSHPKDNAAAAASSKNNKSTSREWPSYDAVLKNMNQADYQHTLTCQDDWDDKPKIFCPHGVVCCATFQVFDNAHNRYTGLLASNQTHKHCILRLSSAMQPPKDHVQSYLARMLLYTMGEKLRTARLFPAAALKVFRPAPQTSANLLLGGSKVGQRQEDYFAHCLATSMTERMPRPVRPLVQTFWKYSDHPLSLGVSDVCRPLPASAGQPDDDATLKKEHDDKETELEFPFCIIFKPVYQTPAADTTSPPADSSSTAAFDQFVDQAVDIPAGTVLFDVYACASPQTILQQHPLERIGTITSTSHMIPSTPDDHLFFQHQPKEDDYNLKPEWLPLLQHKVSFRDSDNISSDPKKASTISGTVGQLAGWKLFEQQILQGNYVDYETKSASPIPVETS